MQNLPEAYQSLKTRIGASGAATALFDLTLGRLAPLVSCGREETRETPALGVAAIRSPEAAFDPTSAAELLLLGWIDALTRLFLRCGAIKVRYLDLQMLPKHVALDPLPSALAAAGLDMEGAREALGDLRETVPEGQVLPDEIVGIMAILGWSELRVVGASPVRPARVPMKLLHAGYSPSCVAVAKAGSQRYVLTGPHEDGRYVVTRMKARIVTSETAHLDAAGAPIPGEVIERVRVDDMHEIARVRGRSGVGHPQTTRIIVEFERYLRESGRTYGRLIYAA